MPDGIKQWMKRLAHRALRPGLADVSSSLARVEAKLGEGSAALTEIRSRAASPPEGPAVWRGGLGGRAVDARGREVPAMTVKYRDELAYWEHVVKRDSVNQFGAPFEQVFGTWQRDRMAELREFLELDEPGFEAWCLGRTVVEIGAGPYPSIAVMRWKRAVGVDPLADGYTAEGLLPSNSHCDEVTYIASPGENVPLPTGFADLVVAENCLDHVDNPGATASEIRRLLAPGGMLWLLVDLMNYRDHLHPNPFSEQTLRDLLAGAGFEPVRDRVSDHKSHPNAYGEYRGLLRRLGPGVAGAVSAAGRAGA